MKFRGLIFLLLISLGSFAQRKTGTVSGKVIDENENPLPGVSIVILGQKSGFITSDSGTFNLKIPADRPLALIFTHEGYKEEKRNFYLSENEEERLTLRMISAGKMMDEVIITNEKDRKESGLIKMSPNSVSIAPTATGGVEGLIKILVGSNNELTSQYSVRGGNYDENLIYINDFEIYRPYLIRNGQQEGLSFINPEMVKNINFYNGGFQAKYGDKISSVLDIQYKTPVRFGGSVYISLLEQGLSFEGLSKNKKLTWLIGARTKTNRNLLASQETKGNYLPSASDVQAFLTYKISDKIQLEILGLLSGSKFSLIPESAQKSTAVFSPLFTANLGLDIFFEGQERDRYDNNMLGISLIQKINARTKLKWMVNRYGDNEKEHFDILGSYLFGERSFDKTVPEFGQIVNPLGAGVFQNYARNDLEIINYNVSHKGFSEMGKHAIQWGLGWDHTLINDKLNEWQRKDSAGYTLPFDPNKLTIGNVIKSAAQLDIHKFSGYIQDNIRFSGEKNDLTLQIGTRFNYNSLNKELLISPRAHMSFKPDWKNDFVFKLSAGKYDQPPFYRELRRYDGSINTALKSQKSIQFTGGFDYNFFSRDTRVRITTEAFYKNLWDVVPYDLENVRIRYTGENNAKAYAAGIETRIFTELVKDAESWFSIAISKTMEDLKDDYYYQYKNAGGEIINSRTADQVVADSVKTSVGYVRRPSDRLLTMGLFLQDYLSTNKNFRVHLNMIYGSNMTYNIPNSTKYRNGLIIDPYMRVDIGFSALLLSQKSDRRSHSPFRSFENIWASLEVFNIIDRANVISYELIKDYSNNIFSIPNRLTPRLLNFKLLAKF